MKKVLLTDIIDTLSYGEKCFATLRNIEPIFDPRGRALFSAGRSGAVFKVAIKGEPFALKCYTHSLPFGAEKADYLGTLPPSDTIIRPSFLAEELHVNSRAIDVVLYPWVEGSSLDWAIRKALHDGDTLTIGCLLGEFLRLVGEVEGGEWRHGDLKTENIIIRPNGSMTLVDCDALYAPTLHFGGECGTPNWIHPSRQDAFNSHIDDYAVALIVVSLAALTVAPTIYSTESMVAMPSLGNREEIARLLAFSPHLTQLHEALYSHDYKIGQLNTLLQCIAHQLPELTKPLL